MRKGYTFLLSRLFSVLVLSLSCLDQAGAIVFAPDQELPTADQFDYSEIEFDFDKAEKRTTPDGATVCLNPIYKELSQKHKGHEVLIISEVTDTSFLLKSIDPPGFGFESTLIADPVNGNNALRLGEQKFNAVAEGLRIYSDYIVSPVTINVAVQTIASDCGLAPLATCSPLGSTCNFDNALYPDIWYSIAHANSLAGEDLAPDSDDMLISYYDVSCRDEYYYGTDYNTQVVSVTLLTLHEATHGLGFYEATNNIYSYFLKDLVTDKWWRDLDAEEREIASTSNGDLVWDGANINSLLEGYESGIRSGRAMIFTPEVFKPGSSLSHFDTRFSPNELMEPIYNSTYRLDFTLALLKDIGWNTNMVSDDPYFLPPIPVGLRAHEVTESEIYIKWDDVSDFEDQYLLWVDSIVELLPQNQVEYHLDGLNPNTPHTFTLKAENSRGTTNLPVKLTVYTRPAIPAPPMKGTPGHHTHGMSIDVGENAPDTLVGIFCQTTNQWVQGNFVLGDDKYFQSGWGEIVINGLETNACYLFEAVAMNPDGLESQHSVPVAFYTNPVHDKGDWFLCF